MDLQAVTLAVQVGQLVAFVVAAFKVGHWVGQIEGRIGSLEKGKSL